MRETASISLSFFFAEAAAEIGWRPLADIYRTREGWFVKLDLAGVRPQDISTARQGTRLCIRGIRHDLVVKDGCSHYSMEIPYGHFERTIELPCDVERADLSVEFSEGLLLLHVKVNEEENRERSD